MGKITFDKNLQTGELSVTGFVNAPIEEVWQAWTDPALFAQWWGPHGWTTTVKKLELHPDGSLLYGMKCIDKAQGEWFGKESWGKMVYESINPPHGFSYTDYFCDSDGNIDESLPATTMSMRFESVGGGTRMINSGRYKSAEDLQKVIDMGVEQGLTETWERLDDLLAK